MKNLQNSLFIILAGLIFPNISYAVVGLHQKDMEKRRGKEVAFTFEKSPGPNANSSYNGPNRSPLIRINTGYLELFIDDEIITPVCHELGHFLGETSFASHYAGSFAIESEADYFGGKCAVRYYQSKGLSLNEAQEKTIQIAKDARSKIRKTRFDPDRARLVHVAGIDIKYAN